MPRRLTALSVDWGSLVDNPANKGARVALFKRDDSVESTRTRLAKWLSVGSTRANAVDQLAAVAKMHGEPMTFGDVREAAANEKVLDEVMQWTFGFRRSVESILSADPDDTDESKSDLLERTLDEFVTALRGAVPRWAAGETVGKAGHEEDIMDEKQMKALLATLPEERRATVEKALTAATKAATDEKAARETFEKETDEKITLLEKRATEAEEKVVALEKKDPPKEEDVLKSLPEEVRKRLETAEKRAEEAEKIAKAERSARELSEITKRVEADMALIDGTAAEKAALIQRLRAVVTKEDADRVEAILTAASKAIGASSLFSEIGQTGALAGSATAKLEAIAEDLRKQDPKLRKSVAMAEAAKLHPDLRREQLAEQRPH